MVKKKILITGVSGLVGTVLAASLKETYEVSGVDLKESTEVPILKADCSSIEEMLPAFSGVDTVIDLASNPSQYSEWDIIHDVNLRCTSNALEAARISGVKRVIFASSNHATGMYETDSPYSKIVKGEYTGLEPDSIPLISTRMPVRPDGPYGIAKAFGEAAGRFYSDQYGLSSLSIRIGTLNTEGRPINQRQFATLLTHYDLVNLFSKCIEAPHELKFGIYYGVSNNKWRFWDINNSEAEVGYRPNDNAEMWREGSLT
ncbi:NAD(P)-dependent oxidoreductase [Chloroflexi bacterium]|nr:NAD(P)-dependent oxidoreductase [Chloroflexota bacterium]